MFVVSDAGMTNLGEIAGESESVIITFGFAPSEFVDCDQENMFTALSVLAATRRPVKKSKSPQLTCRHLFLVKH